MLLQSKPDTYYIGTILLTVLVVLVIILILLFIRKIVTTITDGIEMIYAYFTKKPIFVHFYPILRKLNSHQEHILKNQFTFYNRLDKTKNILENLIKSNNDFTNLYFSIDGPKNQEDNDKIQKIIRLLKNYKKKLNNVKLINNENNLGLQQNILKSIDYVLDIKSENSEEL